MSFVCFNFIQVVVHKKDDVINFIHLVIFNIIFLQGLELESDHGWASHDENEIIHANITH